MEIWKKMWVGVFFLYIGIIGCSLVESCLHCVCSWSQWQCRYKSTGETCEQCTARNTRWVTPTITRCSTVSTRLLETRWDCTHRLRSSSLYVHYRSLHRTSFKAFLMTVYMLQIDRHICRFSSRRWAQIQPSTSDERPTETALQLTLHSFAAGDKEMLVATGRI